MTAAETAKRQPRAAGQAVPAERGGGVAGAGGIKTATRPEIGREAQAIEADQADNKFLHLSIFFQCREREARISLLSLVTAPFCASATMSRPASAGLWRRKLSLASLLRRLRSTARGADFFATTRPRRAGPGAALAADALSSLFNTANTTKRESRERQVAEKTRLNSAGRDSRCRRGNRAAPRPAESARPLRPTDACAPWPGAP